MPSLPGAPVAFWPAGPGGPSLVLPLPVRDRDHVLHWHAWRRHHQAAATACHQQRHHRHDQP
ncbi:hypothetical protein [Streptomyces sp. NPDC056453]|uniref:hypothetical protein n=1 Tax=Streptomyces sp. NPDC056453 TaxID=3345822 RepID=UPI0036C9C4DD